MELHQARRTATLNGMGNANDLVRFLVLAAATALLILNHRVVIEAIEAFKDNFPRGGPPTPMHPSPVSDTSLLLRRSPKKAMSWSAAVPR